MDDVRQAAEERASRPKKAPVGASFESERQRSKNALVKQIESMDGRNVRMIAAATAAPERKLGEHHRDSEDKDATEIDEEECGTTVFLSNSRETPHVSQSDSRPYCGCDKTYFRTEFCFVRHVLSSVSK